MPNQTALVHAEMARLKSTADDVVANSRAAAAKLMSDIEGSLMPVFRGEGATCSGNLTNEIDTNLATVHRCLDEMSAAVGKTDSMHAGTDSESGGRYNRVHGQMNIRV